MRSQPIGILLFSFILDIRPRTDQLASVKCNESHLLTGNDWERFMTLFKANLKSEDLSSIHDHLLKMKEETSEETALHVLQDTVLSLLQSFAPKLFRYRFHFQIIETVGKSYLKNQMDDLLVVSSSQFDSDFVLQFEEEGHGVQEDQEFESGNVN